MGATKKKVPSNELRIPIPVIDGEKKRQNVVIRKVQTSVIADSNKIMQKGDIYKALQTFIAGGIEDFDGCTDRAEIYALVGKTPYKSAWFLATRIIMQDEKDDGIEGMYPCPRCGTEKVCEYNEDPDLDTSDYISDMKVEYADDNVKNVFELSSPVVIKNEDDAEAEVRKVEIDFPTLNHCSQAFNRVGDKDEIRLQLAIFVQALRKINDEDVDSKFKNAFGMTVLERMNRTDIRDLAKMIDRFGMNTRVKKSCNKCGKQFEVNLNTANFFGFALR